MNLQVAEQRKEQRMKRNNERPNGVPNDQSNLRCMTEDLFDEMDTPEGSPGGTEPNQVDEASFQDAVTLEDVPNAVLIAELTSRRFVVAHINEVDLLHDEYFTDPGSASAHAREL